MLSMLPSASPTEVANAFAVIALVADVEGCAKRLKELQALVDQEQALTDQALKDKIAAEQALNTYNDLASKQDAKCAKANKEANSKLDAAQSKLDQAEQLAAKNASDMAAREAALNDTIEQVSKAQDDLAAREQVLADAQTSLAKSLNDHADAKSAFADYMLKKQKDMDAAQAAVDALKADYQARIDKIRSLAS